MICKICPREIVSTGKRGPVPKFCSPACRQQNYRDKRKPVTRNSTETKKLTRNEDTARAADPKTLLDYGQDFARNGEYLISDGTQFYAGKIADLASATERKMALEGRLFAIRLEVVTIDGVIK